jgi:hypothetical protein
MIKQSRQGGDRGVSIWIIALLLVVAGVLLARLVRATLAPALRPEPMQIEMHVV